MASNLIANNIRHFFTFFFIVSYSNGLQPNSDGLQPTSDGICFSFLIFSCSSVFRFLRHVFDVFVAEHSVFLSSYPFPLATSKAFVEPSLLWTCILCSFQPVHKSGACCSMESLLQRCQSFLRSPVNQNLELLNEASSRSIVSWQDGLTVRFTPRASAGRAEACWWQYSLKM